ncbi:MAG: DoxX family protein [bacterium]|nr:DoxX family protein [bacterium]
MNWNRYLSVVGRVLLCLIFLTSGVNKILTFEATAARMADAGMPLAPLLLVGAIGLELVGSALVITGFHIPLGALMLLVFLVPATFIFHAFWKFEEPQQTAERIQFMKNLAITGALLGLIAPRQSRGDS